MSDEGINNTSNNTSNNISNGNITQNNTKSSKIQKINNIINNRYFFLLIAVIIIIANIYLRIGMLKFPGLFEPDGYYYYTAIRQSVSQGFTLPTRVNLSGYPQPSLRGEDPGLIYMTTIPYFFLRYLGVSILDIMRSMGVVFGILDAIAAYFLVKYLSKSRLLGLLSMLFVSLSSGNIARTAALIYRGDVWVSFFIMLALIMLFVIINQNDKKKKYIYTVIAGFVISLGFLIWTGGVIIPELVLVSTGALALYAFIVADNKLNFDIALLLIASFISFLLGMLYVSSGISYSTMMNGVDFFVLFIPILIILALSYFIISLVKKDAPVVRMFKTYKNRFLIVIILLLLSVLAIVSIPKLNSIVTNGHAIYETSNIGSTTQELQLPSMPFLISSFGIQLFLAPLGVLFFIFFSDPSSNEIKTYLNIKNKKIPINASPVFIVLLVYFIVMAYLQGGAIRFNSMLSIPIAIFSAYAIYSAYILLKKYHINLSNTSSIPLSSVVIGFAIAIIIIQFLMVFQQSMQSAPADGVNPEFLQALEWMNQNTPQNARILALWPDGSLVEAVANRTSFMDSVGSENSIRIEQFHSYLFNGTPDNAYLYNKAFKPDYILARNFWYDELAGIAIEGNLTNPFNVIGSLRCSDSTNQCTLFASSISNVNPGTINATLQMRFNATSGLTMLSGYGNSSILVDGLHAGMVTINGNISNQNGAWNGVLYFNDGLVGELNINGISKSDLNVSGALQNNLQNYGFTLLGNSNLTHNSTTNIYRFYNPPPPNGNGYEAILLMRPSTTSNTMPNVTALFGFVNNPNFVPLKNIEFLNTSSYNYNIVTSNANTVANYTLLIEYSGTQISNAWIIGSKLFYTNLYKMLYECGYAQCALSSGNVTAQLVYANADSKIIKMTYTG